MENHKDTNYNPDSNISTDINISKNLITKKVNTNNNIHNLSSSNVEKDSSTKDTTKDIENYDLSEE